MELKLRDGRLKSSPAIWAAETARICRSGLVRTLSDILLRGHIERRREAPRLLAFPHLQLTRQSTFWPLRCVQAVEIENLSSIYLLL